MKVEFSTRQTVVGTKCDYNANPYKVYTSDDGVDWLEVASNLRGDHTFTEPLSTKFARYRWESTLGSNGFHFQFLASPPNLQISSTCTTLCAHNPNVAEMAYRHGQAANVDILSVSVTDATGPLYFHVTTEAHDQNMWGRCSTLLLTFYDAADNQQWAEYSGNVPRSGSYQPFEWEGGGSKLVVNAGGRLELSGTGCWGGGIHTRNTRASFTVDDCGKATGVGVCPSAWNVIALADSAPANDPIVGVLEGDDGTREVFFKPVPNDGSLDNEGNGLGASAFEIRYVAPRTGDYRIRLTDRHGSDVFSNTEGSACRTSCMETGCTDSMFICSSDPRSSRTNPDTGTPDLSSCSTYHYGHQSAHTFSLSEGTHSLWLASREVCTLASHITITVV